MPRKVELSNADETLIPRNTAGSSPGRTLGRVYAALAGDIAVEILEPDEVAIFEDLFAEREMQGNTPARAEFAAKMHTDGGFVGEDDRGRLIRTISSGSFELIEDLSEEGSCSSH